MFSYFGWGKKENVPEQAASSPEEVKDKESTTEIATEKTVDAKNSGATPEEPKNQRLGFFSGWGKSNNSNPENPATNSDESSKLNPPVDQQKSVFSFFSGWGKTDTENQQNPVPEKPLILMDPSKMELFTYKHIKAFLKEIKEDDESWELLYKTEATGTTMWAIKAELCSENETTRKHKCVGYLDCEPQLAYTVLRDHTRRQYWDTQENPGERRFLQIVAPKPSKTDSNSAETERAENSPNSSPEKKSTTKDDMELINIVENYVKKGVWPVAGREFCTINSTFRTKNWDKIVLLNKSIDHPAAPVQDNPVRADVIFWGLLLEKVTDEEMLKKGKKCKYTCITQIDPKGNIPKKVYEYFVRWIPQQFESSNAKAVAERTEAGVSADEFLKIDPYFRISEDIWKLWKLREYSAEEAAKEEEKSESEKEEKKEETEVGKVEQIERTEIEIA